jgi:glutamine amidotransferase
VLEGKGLVAVIKDEIKKKKPFLGICLGMQLLFQESEEAAKCKGLGILKGKVKRFADKPSLKVPHMGWNQLKKSSGVCPLLKGVADDSFVYFCHSYYPQPRDARVSAALTDYGINFTSVAWQDNVYGVQFHPEKSQEIGLKIVENFVKSC